MGKTSRPAHAARPAPRWTSWRAKLILVLVTFSIMLVTAEVGVRLLGFQPIYGAYSKASMFWRTDSLLGWSHEPSSSGTYVGPRPWPIEFRTPVEINSRGLRGPEIEPVAPEGRRVLFVGDSMVAAFEVAYEDTFVARLGPLLTESLGLEVQTINAGVRGYGTDQEYLYFRDRGRQWEPDLVVLVFSGNDLRNNMTLHRMRRPFGKPAFRLSDDGSLELVGHPVPEFPICSQSRMNDRFEVVRDDSLPQRTLCRAQMALFDYSALFTVGSYGIRRHPDLLANLYHMASPNRPKGKKTGPPAAAIAVTEALLRELAVEVIEATGRRLLITGDDRNLVGWDPAALSDVADVFSYEAVFGDDPEAVAFKNDSHFNELGHRRIAELLAPVLAERLQPLADAPEGVVR